MSDMNLQEYAGFLHEIKGRIRDRQLQAMRSMSGQAKSPTTDWRFGLRLATTQS
jgi:hypothetical protein